MQQTFDKVQETINFLKDAGIETAEVGIILGTGLGRLVNDIEIETEISYEKIPHFPTSTVETHAGKLIYGKLSGKKVLAMQGRFHYYEGYTMQEIVYPVRVMKFLGIKTLIVSNACGGINPLFSAGTIMVITDHINLLGNNPLIGSNDDRIGPRFPDMSEPYSEVLLAKLSNVALEYKIPVERGVYAAMTGPCLETKAEYRLLKIVGADVIGMSTVPEVIAAVHAGIDVLGLSVITDECLPDALNKIDIKKIIATANMAEPKLVKLIKEVLKKI